MSNLPISIYRAKGDEGFVRLAAEGQLIARVPAKSPKGIALLRLNEALEEARIAIQHSDLSFDLRWNADMRAIKRWQAAHPGNDLVWPDHADLCVWLMEQHDQMTKGQVPA